MRKSRKIPYCQVSHTHERTPGSVDRDPIVIWRPANDRTNAIPRLYALLALADLFVMNRPHTQAHQDSAWSRAGQTGSPPDSWTSRPD